MLSHVRVDPYPRSVSNTLVAVVLPSMITDTVLTCVLGIFS